MASRKLFGPSTAVYQAGRGSEPMTEVGRVTPADALYIVPSLAAQCLAFPIADEGKGRKRSEIVRFAFCRRVLHQRAVGLRQWRAGIAKAVDDGGAAGA